MTQTLVGKIIEGYLGQGESPSKEEILSSETIIWPSDCIFEGEYEDFFESAAELENIKTILVDPNCEVDPEVVSELKNIIKSGTNIEFSGESGGYLFFYLEYGVDECSQENIRQNSYPLCKNFSAYLDILDNPNEFMNSLSVEDTYGLFKKIEDDIYDICGDGEDMFLNVKKIYCNDDAESLLWDRQA